MRAPRSAARTQAPDAWFIAQLSTCPNAHVLTHQVLQSILSQMNPQRLLNSLILLRCPDRGLRGGFSLLAHLPSKACRSLVAASKRLWLSWSSPSKDVTWAFTEALSSAICYMKKSHFLSAMLSHQLPTPGGPKPWGSLQALRHVP